MVTQAMVSHSDGGNPSQYQPLARQNSMYSLTLDEVQNQLGDMGKPLSSMNLDELLKSVWSAEANQSIGIETEGTPPLASQPGLQRQPSVPLASSMSKKTVDEVWKDIQRGKYEGERKSRERQPTLGEMTLEDFLVKAGVVVETSADKKVGGPVSMVDAVLHQNIAPQFPQAHWMQYPHPQYQHHQQGMMGVYMAGQPIHQPMHMEGGVVMDVSYSDNQVQMPSPLLGTLSDTQMPGRKRGAPEDVLVKTVERRQKRMIKNRESAARSRARKQAYTNELENKVSRLEEENERLRKRKELENLLPSVPPPEPKFQLRRTTSAPF